MKYLDLENCFEQHKAEYILMYFMVKDLLRRNLPLWVLLGLVDANHGIRDISRKTIFYNRRENGAFLDSNDDPKKKKKRLSMGGEEGKVKEWIRGGILH